MRWVATAPFTVGSANGERRSCAESFDDQVRRWQRRESAPGRVVPVSLGALYDVLEVEPDVRAWIMGMPVGLRTRRLSLVGPDE